MTAIFLIMMAMGSTPSVSGGSTVISKTEMIEIKNPTKAFHCGTGDGGFLPTTISLNSYSIPEEFGGNFRNTASISADFVGQSGNALPCTEALKPIEDEIMKQGGQLVVSASRRLSRFAYPTGKSCRFILSENVQINIGHLELAGVTTFFIKEEPMTSAQDWFACKDLLPDKI